MNCILTQASSLPHRHALLHVCDRDDHSLETQIHSELPSALLTFNILQLLTYPGVGLLSQIVRTSLIIIVAGSNDMTGRLRQSIHSDHGEQGRDWGNRWCSLLTLYCLACGVVSTFYAEPA